MEKKCAACTRKAVDKYCVYHGQARDCLKNHYSAWVEAYGGIQWEDFLKRLLKMDETGLWIKDVIATELKK